MDPVLVLDDEPVIRFVICEALRDAGFEAQDTASGQAALQWLAQGLRPAAVVVDLLMPGMSGREFLEMLRGDPRWFSIPVVVVTGAELSAEVYPAEGSYQQLVQKPFDLHELVRVVEGLVSISEA